MLLASHNMREEERLCNSVVMMIVIISITIPINNVIVIVGSSYVYPLSYYCYW